MLDLNGGSYSLVAREVRYPPDARCVELREHERAEPVAECVCQDESGQLTVNTFGNAISVSVLEWFIGEARASMTAY
jgi:hypothetical protein